MVGTARQRDQNIGIRASSVANAVELSEALDLRPDADEATVNRWRLGKRKVVDQLEGSKERHAGRA